MSTRTDQRRASEFLRRRLGICAATRAQLERAGTSRGIRPVSIRFALRDLERAGEVRRVVAVPHLSSDTGPRAFGVPPLTLWVLVRDNAATGVHQVVAASGEIVP